MIDPVDLDLIQRCLMREKEAWDALVCRFSAPVYDAVLRTLQRYYHEDCRNAAGDVFQDVFVHLLENGGHALAVFEGRNGCQLKHYLRTIAVRLTVDFLRKQRPMVVFNDNTELQVQKMGYVPQGSSDASGKLGNDEEEKLQRLMTVLNPRERELCSLLFQEKHSVNTISMRLGITPENVYVRKNRLLAKLRAAVILMNKEDSKKAKTHVCE